MGTNKRDENLPHSVGGYYNPPTAAPTKEIRKREKKLRVED